MIRRLIPYTLLPLALLATGLASGLWLRAFPSSVMAAPLLGAAVISVLLPVAVSGLFTTRLWVTALIDVIALVLYELFVVLKDPAGLGQLWTGLVHGPSQLLTFALPLVSPRSLLVAPVALCWVSGAIAGECIGRSWQSVLPYASWLVTFGLTYAGTARAITNASTGRRVDTLLAGGLLLALLLTRAAQAWVGQNESAEVTQANGVLPVRGFAIGAVLALALAAAAAGTVQSSAFHGPPTTPQRVPSVDKGTPLTPLSFIGALRQDYLTSHDKRPVFRVTVSRRTLGYFPIASVDYYDGDGWSFSRTFRPSGGVIPGEIDPSLRPPMTVDQTYHLDSSVLTATPWMPYQSRPQRISGISVDVDAGSGMIVPASRLAADDSYKVTSRVPKLSFDALGPTAFQASSAGPEDRALPADVRSELSTVIESLAGETKIPETPSIPFLQAVAKQFRDHYGLSNGSTNSTPTPSSSTSSSPKPPSKSTSSAHRFAEGPVEAKPKSPAKQSSKPAAKSTSKSTSPPQSPPSAPGTSTPPGSRTGGTSFRDVVESIFGGTRSATAEQYATLIALIARQLNVPARVVTGFRVLPKGGSGPLPAGEYSVTTADAWTWVEVPVDGQGWVVLDASPSRLSGRQQQSVGATPSQSPSSTSAPNALVTSGGNSGNAPAPPSAVPHPHSVSTLTVLVLALIAVAVLIVVIVLVLLLRKRLRAHRRRRLPDPRSRLLGAWHESIDVLVESGLPELEAMTSAEIADATTTQFGESPGMHVAYLGEAANLAIFSPTTWVTSADADAAWSQHWLLRNEVRRTLKLRDRLAAGVRYHRIQEYGPLVGPASWADTSHTAKRRKRRGGRHVRLH